MKGVDMWSLGCILGEMLLNRPLFPGSSTLNQIERILDILPHPTREDMHSIRSELGERGLEKVAVGAGPIPDILPHPTREDMNSIRSELGERVLEKVAVGYVSTSHC